MDATPGAATFRTSGSAYDSFMGRYSIRLAPKFADFAGVAEGQQALDVGCGPGALTRILVERLGARAVAACDPSESFASEAKASFPDVDVRVGRIEAIPFEESSFDTALAQLVLHFASDPEAGADELRRVLRPGGTVAACVWDFGAGMEMLRAFWDAAQTVNPAAPDEHKVLRFGKEGEIADLYRAVGFRDVEETMLEVTSTYSGFDEFWAGFLAGIGPAGAYAVSLEPEAREAVRQQVFKNVGSPSGEFGLGAKARAAKAVNPP